MCIIAAPIAGAAAASAAAGSATTTALTAASIAATIAATGLSAYSSYQQQQSQNQAAEYNAAMLRRNQQQAELEARDVETRGKIAENEQRLQVKRIIGAQRAAAASSGLLVDQGSNLDLTGDSAAYGELDALTIRNNHARQAWGIRNQAADYGAQANLVKMGKTNPLMSAGGSLLSGGSRLASQLYEARKVGLTNASQLYEARKVGLTNEST